MNERKRVNSEKDLLLKRESRKKWKDKGYCKIYLWCPTEARKSIEAAINSFAIAKEMSVEQKKDMRVGKLIDIVIPTVMKLAWEGDVSEERVTG